MTVLRTANDGCWELATNSWGTFLRQVPDPDADTIITDEQLKGFELREDITPIPAPLWQRWIQLCFQMTEKDRRNLEVSCRLLRHEDDRSHWRILVPQQEVSGASVRVKSFDQAIDIETGEVVTAYPPAGWIPCGSSHSHNTMSSFFSGTDDKYELGDPGLHIVVGDINTTTRQYTLKASITANHRRFLIDHQQVVDTTPIENTKPHPSVLEVITLEAPLWQPARSTTGAAFSWLPKDKRPTPPSSWTSSWHGLYGDAWYDDDDLLATASANSTSGSSLNTLRQAVGSVALHATATDLNQLDELLWQLTDLVNDLANDPTHNAADASAHDPSLLHH